MSRKEIRKKWVFTEVHGIETGEDGQLYNTIRNVKGRHDFESARKILQKKHPNFLAQSSFVLYKTYVMDIETFIKNATLVQETDASESDTEAIDTPHNIYM